MIPDFPGWAVGGVRRLRAYDPGHDIVALRRAASDGDLLELGSNESPYGPSERAVAAALASLGDLHRYPDPLGKDLRGALSTYHGLAPENFILGNGSHELLMQVAQVFAGHAAGVVASQFGFAVYPIAAQAADAPFEAAPALAAGAEMPRGHDLHALAAAAAGSCRVIYLANPNNPTGTWFTTDALAGFLQQVGPDRLIVVDEAYAEYVTDPAWTSAIGLIAKHPNLLVTRTFSKAHGLASLRVGYACGHPDLLAVLERVRESFNVNGPALAAAEAALEDREHVASVRAGNAVERDWLRGELLSRGWAVAPSQTNFLLVDFGTDANAVEASLLAQAVVPRPMRGYGLPHCLRLTLGQRADNARLLAALDFAWQGRVR
ncbi:histidinol-phosphate transaminase [soil metagenome]